MKILIATGIYPPSLGGPATYSKLLFDELPTQGIGVKVVSFDEVRHFPKIIRHISYFFKLLRRAGNVDIIYAQDPMSVGLPASLVARILRKKFVLKVVGDYAWEQGTQRYGVQEPLDSFVYETKYPPMVLVWKKIQTYVAKHADKVVVPSVYLKTIVQAWGIEDVAIEVVYNAFSPVHLKETKEQLRVKHNLKGNIILSAGRLVPWKGFGGLISVIKDMKVKFPDLKLLIAGDGPQKEELVHIIAYGGLENTVELLGNLPHKELAELIKASDVFVLNTAYEGLSHVLLEVLALGTPIVATNIGGNPELIEDNKEGILVRYNNHRDIEKAIEKILLDDKLQATLGHAGVIKAGYFSKEKMIKGLIEVFKNVCRS